jgi:hypothetical protein
MSELAEEIGRLIEDYIQAEEMPVDLRAITKMQNLLPSYLGTGGCIGLRPAGNILIML